MITSYLCEKCCPYQSKTIYLKNISGFFSVKNYYKTIIVYKQRIRGVSMKIVVPIKQVPETGNVRMDEKTGTMLREGVESIVNPLDLYGIECALQLKEQHGGTVTVFSMGPPKAEKAIREALAMGCDDGFLLSDKAFAGADTWATSYVLSEGIKKYCPDFDLVICGVRATDGDTGQVGPEIAAMLDLPIATFVSRINRLKDGSMQVIRLIENGYENVDIPLPSLITVVNEIAFSPPAHSSW